MFPGCVPEHGEIEARFSHAETGSSLHHGGGFPGTKDFIHGGGFKSYVPFLEEIVVMEGVGHFINKERAEEISTHIYKFIKNF
ncbi:hypothetical protein IFM89_010421 [Coptis chinensis]|uniref:Epoxide hydrolase n=1 Tax=Coptis chinensis TaxID=261450 RepID=A0A835I2T9_9MAGN|nr:hypothetical protein IFM89_010421 [Coptis chinensis]